MKLEKKHRSSRLRGESRLIVPTTTDRKKRVSGQHTVFESVSRDAATGSLVHACWPLLLCFLHSGYPQGFHFFSSFFFFAPTPPFFLSDEPGLDEFEEDFLAFADWVNFYASVSNAVSFLFIAIRSG